MFSSCKVFLIFAALTWDLATAEGDAVKRDLIGRPPGLEFLHLGNFGPVAGLSSHPVFAHLGLAPQQTVGFVGVLLRNGLLAPHALRSADGRPLARDFLLPGPFFGPLGFAVDPYVSFLAANYGRFLPYGLGPQGFFGSTGLPRPQPSGIFKYNDKN